MIAGRVFHSRLLMGTGKFASPHLMKQALEASGAEIVTVALRRVELENPQDSILSLIDPSRYLLLPNTSGARDATEAVRLARIARAAGCEPWVKLEVTPDPHHLLPDPVETLKAAEILVKEGFVVLPYINADPVLAKRLEDVGTATVMPLGSAHWLEAGYTNPGCPRAHHRKSPGPGGGGCRPGSSVPRCRGDGTGRRCRFGQHRSGGGGKPRSHGAGVQEGRGSRTRGVFGGSWPSSARASASSPLTGFLR